MSGTLVAAIVLVAALVVLAVRVLRNHYRLVAVYEWEWALLYRRGRSRGTAGPGTYHLFGPGDDVVRLDRRMQNLVVSGQEVLSRDAIGLKLSLVVQYRIRDAGRLVASMPVRSIPELNAHLHPLVQLPIRQAVAARSLDELLSDRDSIPQAVRADAAARFDEAGIELVSVAVRDIMLAKEIRDAYAAGALAQKQSQALIEAARGESAALRSLANAARMMRDNPELMQLRLLQAMQSGEGRKHTFVVDLANSPAARRVRDLPAEDAEPGNP